MGEILGLGMTHFPGFVRVDQPSGGVLGMMLRDPTLPEHLRNPASWPEPMRKEWGDDQGFTAAKKHRELCFEQFKKQRAILDDFKPDFVVVWGDDQYENFREDVIPPFCVMAYDEVEVKPFSHRVGGGPSYWGEPEDKAFLVKGHQAGGKYIAARLLEEGFDVAYAYKPLHEELGHAFMNTILYLDNERRGFDHRVVPFSVNCYGRRLIAQRGFFINVSQSNAVTEAELDPPSPAPWRCFDLGAATAKVLAQSPYRVALIASSSWSHAFLTPKNWYLWPDVPADKEYYEALRNGDYGKWRNTTTEEIEDRGHQELLNWFCLAGAMAELGRKPDESVFIESWTNNSPKVFAVYGPK